MNEHTNSHYKLQSQINDLENKYKSIKSYLWSQFIWRKGTQNVNIHRQQHINPYMHTITNHFDRNQYTCNQCMHFSKQYIQKDKQNDKYCNLLDSNSIHKTKTLQCYPVKLYDDYTLKSVCTNCGSKKVTLAENDDQHIPYQYDYKKILKQYQTQPSKPCKTIPAYNEDANNIKNCVFVDNQFLQNESHSCRQNYCEHLEENDSMYTYNCSPVTFNAQGNIESICTNPALPKKQYIIKKTPEEQMFYRENNERNDNISRYNVEAFENMKQNMMKTIEAGDDLKNVCDLNSSSWFVVHGYDKNMHRFMHL